MAGASRHGAMLVISATIIFQILVATGVASKDTDSCRQPCVNTNSLRNDVSVATQGNLSRTISKISKAKNCTNVRVSGGNYSGDFELGDDNSTYAKAGTTHVIRAIPYGGGARARRRLAEIDGARSVGRWEGGGQRGLANDCETQMWVLTDKATVVDGYPYYAAFDCADHPVDVNSTWLYIECDDCAKVAPISIACALEAETDLEGVADGDDGDGDGDDGVVDFFTLPVIIGIAAAGLVVLLCLGFFVMRRKKKAPTGSQTFADESEHGASLKGPRVMGTSAPADASFSHVESSHEGPSVGGETATSPAGLYPSAPQHQKNLSKGPNMADTSYGGIYASGVSGGQASRHESRSASSRQPSRAESLVDSRKDSMAEAAAAAHAARAKALGIELVHQEKQQHVGVLRTGGYERRPLGDGSGVKWSAGQNLEPRGVYDDGVASQFSDSAAGSVFSIHPPPDDLLQEHTYDCDSSVAASSPGAYSMYSHFTAGGGTYVGGMSEFAASDVDDLAPLEQPRVMLVRRQDPRGQPPAYNESPPVALDSPDSRPPRGKHAIEASLSMSPAGLAARADQNSARRSRKAGKRADRAAENATR